MKSRSLQNEIQNLMRAGVHQWNHFWFEKQNLLALSLMRIFLCGTLFSLYLVRSFNLEYYSDKSWILKEQALDVLQEIYRPLFLWAFWPDSWNPFVHFVLVISLGLLTLGIGGRFLMVLVWVLNASFIQRNYSVVFGADLIANLFLFYLMFTQSCSRLSLWNKITNRKKIAVADLGSSVMLRMIQVQLCVIYAYTGWEKLRGASWWDGTALWSVLGNPQMTTFDLSFIRSVAWIIPLLSFSTILFEIYFTPFVIWKKTRPYVLVGGVFLHAGIGLLMGLEAFTMTMLSAYFLFLSPAFLEEKFAKGIFRVSN